MTGNKNGLVGLLKGAGVKCYTFHCIIHQEALCGRFLKMNDAMKVVVRIINLIIFYTVFAIRGSLHLTSATSAS